MALAAIIFGIAGQWRLYDAASRRPAKPGYSVMIESANPAKKSAGAETIEIVVLETLAEARTRIAEYQANGGDNTITLEYDGRMLEQWRHIDGAWQRIDKAAP